MSDFLQAPANTQRKPLTRVGDDVVVGTALTTILASRPFRSSVQCSALLTYVVKHTLAGEENLLRERVIGSEVFGRKPDYEPGDDPVVRLRASEVRKRLAQFYQAEGSDADLRISIPSGSYRATFDRREAFDRRTGSRPEQPVEPGPLFPSTSEQFTETETPVFVPVLNHAARKSVSFRIILTAAAMCVLACIATYWLARPKPAARTDPKQMSFWAPLVADHSPIVLCVADDTPAVLHEKGWPTRIAAVIAGTATESHQMSDAEVPLVPYVDAVAMNKLAYWMGSQQDPFVLERSSHLTINELRRGPAILIGAFDNDWSLVLLSKLRFHVAVDPKTDIQWIEDTHEPGNLKWRSAGDVPYTASSVDYAIVTKVLQPDTGKWLVAIGGLGEHGTEAAADLITDKELSRLLPDEVLSANRNIQIVVRTNVINGNNSVPQIVATQSW